METFPSENRPRLRPRPLPSPTSVHATSCCYVTLRIQHVHEGSHHLPYPPTQSTASATLLLLTSFSPEKHHPWPSSRKQNLTDGAGVDFFEFQVQQFARPCLSSLWIPFIPLIPFTPVWFRSSSSLSWMMNDNGLLKDLPVQFWPCLHPAAMQMLLRAPVVLVSAWGTLLFPETASPESEFPLTWLLPLSILLSTVLSAILPEHKPYHVVSAFFHLSTASTIKDLLSPMWSGTVSDLIPLNHPRLVPHLLPWLSCYPLNNHTYSCHRAFALSAPSAPNSPFAGSCEAREFTTGIILLKRRFLREAAPTSGVKSLFSADLYPWACFFSPNPSTTNFRISTSSFLSVGSLRNKKLWEWGFGVLYIFSLYLQ